MAYHVFLSFGEDTAKKFSDHLYMALDRAGCRTFREEEDEHIKLQVEKAIQDSRISVVVLSKDYASSDKCLDQLVMILQQKTISKHQVLPVFYDVDPSDVRNLRGSIKEALTMYQEGFKTRVDKSKDEYSNKVKGWTSSLTEIANLAGMSLENQADRHESKFIQKIVRVVQGKLSRTSLSIDSHLVGLDFQVEQINSWLQDESTDVSVVAICGMGGIGKTTLAKILYNMNFSRFEGSCFLANIREIADQHNGLIHLQEQLLTSILRGRNMKINNVDAGTIKIKEALMCRKVLIILDDVDKRRQIEAVLGMQDWLFPSSKIIVTTRNEWLLRAHKAWKFHKVATLGYNDSIELFSWHAFGQKSPSDNYTSITKEVVLYCDGLPLAIKILASSLHGLELNMWKSQLERLKMIPHKDILQKLKLSYDSLQDDEDRELFLHIACFFVGSDKVCTVEILDGCDFHTEIGIRDLADRCLLTIESNKLVMHHLVQDMARKVVDQESPKEPGKRSRLWNHKVSFNVLREKIGTTKIEGLTLDMDLVKKDEFAEMASGTNRKRGFEEFEDQPFISNVASSFKKYCFGFSSWKSGSTGPRNSNGETLETDAFADMCNLKLLQLKYVQLGGSYAKFPKGLRWLCWHGFPLPSLPKDFHLERVVVLEMPHSGLKNVSNGTMCLKSLKVLNLSHSQMFSINLNAAMLPNLQKFVLNNCKMLVKVSESIGYLDRLVLLDLSDCTRLRKLPRSISMLKHLETLDISGCSNLENLATEVSNMESLRVLRANRIDAQWMLSANREVRAWHSFICPWLLLKPRRNPETSWNSLPSSLVTLELMNCNLTDGDFPKDFSSLSMLREIDLSQNPICSLPDCIKGHAGVEVLILESCKMLQSITGMKDLRRFSVVGCSSLEKVNLQITKDEEYSSYGYNRNLIEFTIMKNHLEHHVMKMEPLENVDDQVIDNLGLPYNLGYLEKPNIKLFTRVWKTTKKLPPQLIRRNNWIGTFLPGSKIPTSFNFRNMGSSISIVVSSCLGLRIRGFTFAAVYTLCHLDAPTYLPRYSELSFTVSNKTKNKSRFVYSDVYGIPEIDEDMTWFFYLETQTLFDVGDEVDISMDAGEVHRKNCKIKEVGVHIVYEQEVKSTRLTIEEEEEDYHKPPIHEEMQSHDPRVELVVDKLD